MNNTYKHCLHIALILGILSPLLSCTPPADPANTPPLITITSPGSKYYTTLPGSIEYSLSETCPTIEITLNGTSATDLSSSWLGLNTLVITATDENGATASESVVYFYNSMPIATDEDAFTRADDTVVGNGWIEVDLDDIMEIKSTHLVAKGCTNADSYPNIRKPYDGATRNWGLQKIDILNMTQDTPAQVYLMFQDFSDFNSAGDYYEQVQAQFETVRENNQFRGYKLLLTFFRLEYGTYATTSGTLSETETLTIDLSNPVTLVFYKYENDYWAVVYDHNQNILGHVEAYDYDFVDLDASGFTQRTVQLMPHDSLGSTSDLITVDNYIFY